MVKSKMVEMLTAANVVASMDMGKEELEALMEANGLKEEVASEEKPAEPQEEERRPPVVVEARGKFRLLEDGETCKLVNDRNQVVASGLTKDAGVKMLWDMTRNLV